MSTPEQILDEAISLKAVDQAKLIDRLIAVLDNPDPEVDKLWAEEVESRVEAYENGTLRPVSLEEVLAKYR